MAERIVVANGVLLVPDRPIIPYIEGDGIGADIWRATEKVINAAVDKAYKGKRKIEWKEVLAGEKAYMKTGEWLPNETIEALKEYLVSIKGPLTTPIGEGFRSINVSIRQILDLYACLRPVKWIGGVPSPVTHPEKLDIVIFRENVEDVYAGYEWSMNSQEAEDIRNYLRNNFNINLTDDTGIGLKPISKKGTQRIVKKAIDFALEYGRKRVTIVHKGNVMKYTEGAFKIWAYEFLKDNYGEFIVTEDQLYESFNGRMPEGKILVNDRITDNMFQQILLRSDEYDVLVTPNLNGDYLSDATAAQVGGLGLAPGGNIGEHLAVFEATHGTAPKYANQDKVNPCSLILSGALMLDYISWKEAAKIVREAIEKTVKDKVVTYDLARLMQGAREVKTSEFAAAIINNM